jgi:hypothetical protein
VAETQSIKNNKLCETNPISEKPKTDLTNYITRDYDNKFGLLTMEKQSQTKPISKGGQFELCILNSHFLQRYRHLLSSQVFNPELTWCHPYKSLECSRKIALIIIADLKTNFRAILRRRQQ